MWVCASQHFLCDMQGYGGYGDVQRMQAPAQDVWPEQQQQSALQQLQSAPELQQEQQQADGFAGGAPQSFFGEMPPPGSVRGPLLASALPALCFADSPESAADKGVGIWQMI